MGKKLLWGGFAAYLICLHAAAAIILLQQGRAESVQSRLGAAGIIEYHPSSVRYMRTIHSRLDASTPPGSAVFLGDSVTMEFPASTVAPNSLNFAIGGQTSAELLESARTYRSIEQARIVFVMAGTNDIRRNQDDGLEDRYRAILALVPPNTPTIMSSPPASTSIDMGKLRKARNAAERACADRPLCRFVDLQSAMLTNSKPDPTLLVQDGIHLSPKGAALWRSMLLSELETIS